MAELTGQSFAGYEILAKLGEGGMGAVYKAKQPILNRFVALKTMAAHLGGDKEFVARFQREAASAATLNHPNVVGVHTAGEVDGTHYIVMEFVEGESVRKRLDREGRIPPAEALAITIYVAQALQYAWNKARLIHRDIKPDNIFLSSAGEVKVGDLGLAKSLATEGTEMTATGMAMGSPHYISPEQATGIKDIDFCTAIYSLGCTLYHMLTGQTPYKGDSSMVVMMKHVHDPAPAIFKAWPQCPMPLGMLVGRMLAKDRNARPKSYEQLVADLFAVSEKLQQAAAPAPAPVPVVTSKPAVVEKTAAATQALAPSPDAPTVALQPSAKPKNLTAIYAAVGVITVIALAGLLLWSPWKTPSTVRDEDASVGHAARTGTAATTPAGDADGFVSLFNGKDLTGWEGRPEFWSVQDGAICGATTKEARAQKNTFLVCTAGEFGDFELRAQFKLAAGDEQGVVNTGVQYRSQIIDREYFTLSGYQADLGFSGKKNLSGGFWEEAGRSVPATPGQRLILREGASPQSPKKTIEFIGSTDDILASYKENDWNDLTVIASGNRLQHYLNGKLASEVIDETAAAASTGTLALQIKTGPPMRVWFRNLFIKKLGSAASATPSLQYSTVASASDTGWQNTINLLPLIDPQKDAVKGSWTLVNGELISSPAYNARLEMPYRPPEEYAFRIVFSRRKGEWDIHQMFPSEGRAFLWAMATASNKRCGFMEFQPDAVRRLTWLDGSLANGQRYTSVVEVRKESFRAHLDGKPITEWRIAPSNPQGTVSAVSVPPRDPTLLGVGSYNSDVVFHRIEVREVTGKGTFTRGAPPNADAAWQNAINLLPLIDPQKDAAGGKWTWSGNTLVSDSAQNGRIAIPYQPPQEYDYRLMFHYTKGYTPTDAGQVIQILSKNGRLFSWIMGAKKGEFIAFETIAGANSADRANPTIIQRKPALRKNVTYTSLVEVRNDGLKAYLNGELLA
ncbi:MAG: DUF1080 domain-containing protein, partial [Verrucomicrobia bacterium]|nr:DUF1080 domain-containing protein [Verrucomicrobiota bacterium]